ncbi:YhfZ family protein [Candidatus Sodalis sp. SoCistrobi]|uniref:YhfZ family protein n=1 Tax=Candidatus Sodalis sp. SoCistrobi TaxID=1922216 RepID=UPI00093B19CC|nr:YhfZ family protein [Candidatus Sodalis sp. SoCistrobi]
MTVKAQGLEHLSPVAFIARSILQLGLGGRLLTTSQYQDRLGIGSGTVQKALLELKKAGAVTLVSRGHQGTFVVAWDFPRLWDAARLPPVHILLPPRGSLEATLVASAMARQCDEWGVVITIGYLRGARSRLAAFAASEADIVLLSAGSAQVLLPEEDAAAGYTLLNVGEGTYYRPGSLVIVEKAGNPPAGRPRVGIDFHSSDHQRLTRAQFPAADYDYVETDFTLLPRAVFLGEIDTGVWHQEASLIPLDGVGLAVRSRLRSQAQRLANAISSAVLVAQADTPVARLMSLLDTCRIAQDIHLQDESAAHALSSRLPIRFP